MTDEIKPCPFCGGRDLKIKGGIGRYVKCLDCENGAHLPGHGCTANDSDAIAAWNTRAAVTDGEFAIAVHNGEAGQRVRTCKNVEYDSASKFECSECGFSVATVPEGPSDWLTFAWSYCPSCGAKVVE